MSTLIIVNNLNDSGPGSLRDAVIQNNNSNNPSIIVFSIVGTIKVLSNFPIIIKPLTISGNLSPGYIDTPLISINFNNFRGFILDSGNIQIKSLEFFNSKYCGISFGSVSDVSIDGCILRNNSKEDIKIINSKVVKIFNTKMKNILIIDSSGFLIENNTVNNTYIINSSLFKINSNSLDLIVEKSYFFEFSRNKGKLRIEDSKDVKIIEQRDLIESNPTACFSLDIFKSENVFVQGLSLELKGTVIRGGSKNIILGDPISENKIGYLEIDNSSDVTLWNNELNWCKINQSKDIKLNKTLIKNSNQQEGLLIIQSKEIFIDNSSINISRLNSILVVNSEKVKITKSSFSGSQLNGISINESCKIIISENTSFENRKNGIEILNSSGIRINGNNLYSNGMFGIFIDKCSDCFSLDGNKFPLSNGMANVN